MLLNSVHILVVLLHNICFYYLTSLHNVTVHIFLKYFLLKENIVAFMNVCSHRMGVEEPHRPVSVNRKDQISLKSLHFQ